MLISEAMLKLTSKQRCVIKQQWIKEQVVDNLQDRRNKTIRRAEAKKKWDILLASFRKKHVLQVPVSQ